MQHRLQDQEWPAFMAIEGTIQDQQSNNISMLAENQIVFNNFGLQDTVELMMIPEPRVN